MPFTIPINFRNAPVSRSATAKDIKKPVSFKVPFGIAGNNFSSSRSTTPLRSKTLRAIAAALSVVDAGKALEIVKEAKENPENVIGATLDENALDQLKILATAISNAERNRDANDEEISSTIRTAAAAVRADATLTAVAVRTLVGDKTDGYESAMFAAALNWVAAIDVRLLETAPREGVKERMLNYVPASVESTAALEDRIEQLEEAVKILQAKHSKTGSSSSSGSSAK